ncbi:MAG: ErfK/YbiS/YcfS/YnhG family protein [Peptococcaceae bacterium BICA1-7]|nr:MAG: ErfK/YbiS/YcfS/YnhG family protein [Peptococcaceae bacterium BICA1-7]HBV99259.1 LysM peptidoglycan-binding domain-containing protein [Desulfotomaculum sp.]
MAEITINEAGTNLVILRSSRKLQHFSGRILKNTYPVAVGKFSTPTPLGNYRVINKVLNPGDILGTRWMGLDIPGGNYGIHGTNNPSSIGKFISLGCIRMQNHDVESLFPQVGIGTPVNITDGPTAGETEQMGNIPGGKTHMVQPGDTLWKISLKYGVPVELIINANKMIDPNRLEVGQVLVIP